MDTVHDTLKIKPQAFKLFNELIKHLKKISITILQSPNKQTASCPNLKVYHPILTFKNLGPEMTKERKGFIAYLNICTLIFI